MCKVGSISMTFKFSIKSILETVIFLSIVLIGNGQEDYDLGDVTPRPLPPEFDFGPEAKINKTQVEEDMEECMDEYVGCFVADRKQEICAINELQQKKTFHSLCLMVYENCKNKESDKIWRFYIDGKC